VVERFHRVSTTGRSHEGTGEFAQITLSLIDADLTLGHDAGIGLSLTAELIKVHGGKLVVTSSTKEESEDGSHGSSFVVTLPLGCAHLPPDRCVSSLPKISGDVLTLSSRLSQQG
jgi:signal transduction histidine kinase